jgi:undecaprenyl-diphosphatase
MLLKLNKETAARFSFLLSVPAIFGAQLLSLKDLGSQSVSVPLSLAGALTAFIVGYFALALLLFIVKKGRLHWFAPYCIGVGILTLIFSA